jgi:DNA-binding NarL/FixJ family response regulator
VKHRITAFAAALIVAMRLSNNASRPALLRLRSSPGFAAVGIVVRLTLTGRKVVVKEVTVEFRSRHRPIRSCPTPRMAGDDARTEVLQRLRPQHEMAERLFVSENTIKTHTSRVFDKPAQPPRQAVRLARARDSSPEWVISRPQPPNHSKG